MSRSRLRSAFIAAALGVASTAALGVVPAHAASDDALNLVRVVIQHRALSTGEKMPIQQVLCPQNFYLANMSLTPTVPATLKGMHISGSPAMSFTDLPRVRTDDQRRVIGWDGSGVLRNDDDERRQVTVEAWCTPKIEDSYTP